MKKSTVIEIIIFLFVVLFLYTGISKIMEYSVFKDQIATSSLLAPIAKPIAWSLPWIEFLATALLVIPRWRLKGLFTSLILMLLFTFYIIAILAFNKNIPCSCGGVLEELSWGQHIIFNSVFIGLAITGILLEKRMKKANQINLSSISNRDWSIQA
jgi:uncharacterized membrane protein YphA (DoxX/SURF4 family)